MHHKAEANGFIKVFDVETASAAGPDGTADCVFHVSVVPGNSAVCVAWHPEINHIAVGGGDCVTRVLYDPTISKKGCLMSSVRAPKRCVRQRFVTPFAVARALDAFACFLPCSCGCVRL